MKPLQQLLLALAERVKPHGHEWKKYTENNYFEHGSDMPSSGKQYFQCSKCPKEKVIKA